MRVVAVSIGSNRIFSQSLFPEIHIREMAIVDFYHFLDITTARYQGNIRSIYEYIGVSMGIF